MRFVPRRCRGLTAYMEASTADAVDAVCAPAGGVSPRVELPVPRVAGLVGKPAQLAAPFSKHFFVVFLCSFFVVFCKPLGVIFD